MDRELTDKQKKTFEAEAAKMTPEDEEKVKREYDGAEQKAEKRGADPKLLDGVKTLWQMLRDPDYTMSWQTKAWIIFALGYFISPIDLIPDVIPVIGYLDDILVVTWVLHNLQDEVVAYRKAKGLA
jgi:uncharacterized membrane protein YkvA (DUF1232 family)